MLSRDNTVLIIVDLQGKLAHLMHKKEELFKNDQIMIQGANILNVPVVWLEQYPKGLGPTIPEVAKHLKGLTPIEKVTFNSCLNENFVNALASLQRKHVLVVGIEAHICVYQTVIGLLSAGYHAHVIADAVSSRTEDNKLIGLEKMKDSGAKLTSTETVLFELTQAAQGPEFKQILELVK